MSEPLVFSHPSVVELSRATPPQPIGVAQQSEQFDRFIDTFFGMLNCRGHKPIQFGILPAPHHTYSVMHGEVYQLQEPIARAQVRFLKQYWTGKEVVTLDDRTVRDIGIQTSSDPWPQRATAVAHAARLKQPSGSTDNVDARLWKTFDLVISQNNIYWSSLKAR